MTISYNERKAREYAKKQGTLHKAMEDADKVRVIINDIYNGEPNNYIKDDIGLNVKLLDYDKYKGLDNLTVYQSAIDELDTDRVSEDDLIQLTRCYYISEILDKENNPKGENGSIKHSLAEALKYFRNPKNIL